MEEGEEAAGAELKRLWSFSNAVDAEDSYHKRAKDGSEGRSASVIIYLDASGSSMERTDGFGIASSSRNDSDMFCQNFILNYGRKDDNCQDFEVHIDLTDDLLHKVFSFLDHVDLSRSAMVCRQWRVASSHEDFWRVLNFNNMKISIERFENMFHRYPNATEVNVYGVPAVNSVNVFGVPAVNSLAIKAATTLRCPQLRSLSLKGTNMIQAMLNCPLLQHLNIRSCDRLPDAAIRSAVTSCPQLESLDVDKCSCVSNETLRGIAQACAGLRILNASYCPNITFESVHLPMLTVLKLHRCENITSATMAWIANSPALEVLELVDCYKLTSVTLHLSCLQSFSLVHCRKFTELNLQSPMLSSITISSCPALQRVTITSNALQRLALKKQENLTTLVLQCQSLQEVDLSGCKSLSNCDVNGGCPMLKSLNLDNCESLTEVRFCNSSLSSLSLVGCRAVTSLDLKCPRVEQICLDGCDNLETAFLQPVALRSLNVEICPKLRVLTIEAPYMVSLELKCCIALSEASIICPLLTSLDASFCGQLRDDCLSATAASCPLIQSLVLMSCSSIGCGGFSSLEGLQNLTFLDLSYTSLMNLEPIFKSCIQLKVLKLHTCRDLTDSSLEPLYKEGALPALEELDLSYGFLCQTVIDDLLAFCTHLTHLSLNGYANMHDLDYSGVYNSSEDTQEPAESANRFLQNLSCVGCPNIRKVLIPHSARFDHLSSLNLSLSLRLKEVDLSCFNLVLLNLSNCCSLEVLKLGCPRLASLSLQSCKMDEAEVEAAISGCCSLETLDLSFCPKISSVGMVRFRTVCPSLKNVFSNPDRLQNRFLASQETSLSFKRLNFQLTMQATLKANPLSFHRFYFSLPPFRITSASPFSSSSSPQWFSFLRDAISSSDLRLGQCTHARILTSEENPERFLINNLITMYSKCGSRTYARRVFDKMPERDLVSWNSILAAYAQSSEHVIENIEQGFDLFRVLRQKVVFTSRMTLSPLLKLCLCSGYVWASEAVHGYACKIGLDSDEFVAGGLVNIYLKFCKAEEGRVLFEEMPERDVVLWNLMLKAYLDMDFKEEAVELSSAFHRSGLYPNGTNLRLLNLISGDGSEGRQMNGKDASDVRSKNQILTKYLQASQYSAVLRYFADMVESNLECDNVTFILVLSTAVRLDSLALGMQVHCMALKLGFDLMLTVANSLINMYCKLRKRRRRGSSVSVYAAVTLWPHTRPLYMTSVLKATSSLSESLSLSKQVHVHAIKTNNVGDSFVSTALIDAYSWNKCMKEAEVLFERNKFDLVACNAMMSGYTQSNDGHKTLELFALMHKQGERSDDFTLATVVKTCGSLFAINQGKQVHAYAIKSGYDLDLWVSSGVLDMYVKCGDMKAAHFAFNCIPAPDDVAWTTMISGCIENGEEERAFHVYSQMRLKGVLPDEFTIATLAKASSCLTALEQGRQIHANALKLNCSGDPFVGTSLVDMYAKHRRRIYSV
ncbi:F-box domain-containing protein [Hirschfeldia incana]|nr:F-box domain-containing protein [Hirschfeldia incana]